MKKTAKSWSTSDKNIKAVQVVFELEQAQSKTLRITAIENDLSPSDLIREIIQLPRKKPVRPRLSISLSQADYEMLGKRYELEPNNTIEIRNRIKEELVLATQNNKL